MRIKALTKRILIQIAHDRRTAALILIAPLLILTIVYSIFNSSNTEFDLGVINCSKDMIEGLEENQDYDISIREYSEAGGIEAVKNQEIIAAIDGNEDSSQVKVYLDGANLSNANKVKSIISLAAADDVKAGLTEVLAGMHITAKLVEPDVDVDYIYGEEDGNFFDSFGAPLIGIIIFFLVFLISGINFLTERTSGTLEKLLSTPIRRSEIIGGYTLGFSILAFLQSLLITGFVVYVLGITLIGSVWYVLLINLLTAVCALTLGTLLSTMAESEFQMVQFVPIVILPQVFLCGLFDLSGGWEIVGHFMPLYYTTQALNNVMLRGSGFSEIWQDCLILLAYILLFMLLNIRFLKKQRKI